MNRCILLWVAFCLGGGIFARAWGGNVDVSGLVDITHREGDKRSTINNNLAGDSPFNDLRVKLFVDAWPSSHFGVLTELLYDESGGTLNVIRFDGAYAVFLGVGTPYLNVKVGKIPSPFGSWAPRTYSDKNPLIGLPLMYHYFSSLRANQIPADSAELLAHRGQGQNTSGFTGFKGGGSAQPFNGLPMIYDPCWDFGAEAIG